MSFLFLMPYIGVNKLIVYVFPLYVVRQTGISVWKILSCLVSLCVRQIWVPLYILFLAIVTAVDHYKTLKVVAGKTWCVIVCYIGIELFIKVLKCDM